MKRSLLALGLAVLVSVLGGGAMSGSSVRGAEPTSVSGLHVVKTFTIPTTGEPRWDYITIDPEARRLYVPQATRVVVLDADKGTVLGEVADTPGVHGVALVTDLHLGFASNGKNDTVSVFDTRTFKTVKTLKAGKKPDAIIYDPFSKHVLVMNGNGGNVTVIDPTQLDVEPTTIEVGGKLEFAVTDWVGHVYVNVEDKDEVAVIDTKAMKVTAHWSLAPGTKPTGLAMDTVVFFDGAHRHLIVGCSNEKMILVDTGSGKVVGTPRIGKGVDGVEWDNNSKLALSANGQDGTLTVVQEDKSGHFAAVETIKTRQGARTLAVDGTGQVYLPCVVDAEKKTFGVLVLGR
ncbi:MAG: YncE family protein [Phycisphaerae bacterium]